MYVIIKTRATTNSWRPTLPFPAVGWRASTSADPTEPSKPGSQAPAALSDKSTAAGNQRAGPSNQPALLRFATKSLYDHGPLHSRPTAHAPAAATAETDLHTRHVVHTHTARAQGLLGGFAERFGRFPGNDNTEHNDGEALQDGALDAGTPAGGSVDNGMLEGIWVPDIPADVMVPEIPEDAFDIVGVHDAGSD